MTLKNVSLARFIRGANVILSGYYGCCRYVAVKLTNKGDHFCKRPLRNINPCYEHPHNTEEINHLKQLTHPNIIQFFKGILSLLLYNLLQVQS